MSGHTDNNRAGRRDGRPMPWPYSIVGLSVLGWCVIAALAYALRVAAARMLG